MTINATNNNIIDTFLNDIALTDDVGLLTLSLLKSGIE